MPDAHRSELYRFCPRCGAETIERRSQKQVVCRTCGLELYFNPCAAVAAILLDAEDRVLLVRRAHEPARGKLVFPGGYVDDGESAEDALRREVQEETGLECGPLTYFASFPNTYPFAGVVYQTLDQFFVARLPDFAAARPLDGVDGIVTAGHKQLRIDDLAFDSMKNAWRLFQVSRTSGHAGGEG